ncbi:type IVB secretion system protein IcmH/DotU [Pseudomonas sp. SDO5271_S396]
MELLSDYPQDEKTILLDREGYCPERASMTDFPSPPRFEQLEDRMIYTAGLQGAEYFNMGVNRLLASAWPLLSEAAQLKGSAGRESLQTLNERLSAAISGFEARALHEGVENGQVVSARYVLCCVIDESVVTTAWGSHSDWSTMSLLSRFHHETFGGEKFFQLLERLSRDPIKHVAMLELMYLCLSIGFEGKYRVVARGWEQLEGIRDALYRQITHVRGDAPGVLTLSSRPARLPRRALRRIPASWFVLSGLAASVILYAGFAWVLGQERVAALHSFQLSTTHESRLTL